MSVNDIMSYVSKTPGNTNPAVIKSMVEAENYSVLEQAQKMDEEVLAAAKAYADTKGGTSDWNDLTNKPFEKIISDDEFLLWLNNTKIVEPFSSVSGEVYVDSNNKIYIL